VQYLWLSNKKEKESQEKNNQKESQEEKEIVYPRLSLAGTKSMHAVACSEPIRPLP